MRSADQIPTQSPRRWRVPILWLTIPATAVVAIMAYSLFTTNRMVEHDVPLVDAVMELRLEATLGHLWFEEIISGDRHEDIAVVWAHLDQSAWYAQATLKGAENPEGTIVPCRWCLKAAQTW